MLGEFLLVSDMLMANGPQGRTQPYNAGAKGHPVCALVALQPIQAHHLATGALDSVCVVRLSVEDVEHVGGDDGGERDETPVLAQATDPKGFGNNGREDAKQETIPQAREAGDEAQQVRILNVESADLGAEEDNGGKHQAPDATSVQALDEKVGTDATGQSSQEAADRQDGDMHLLTRHQKLGADGIIVLLPEGLGVVANVVDGHETDTRQDGHDQEQLPKFKVCKELESANIYSVRTIQINNAVRHQILRGITGTGVEGRGLVGIFTTGRRGFANGCWCLRTGNSVCACDGGV